MPTASSRHIRTTDMLVIDNVFGMGDGYVLNFSNRTFSEFFAEELGVDIDQPRWSVDGTSKATRLRTTCARWTAKPPCERCRRCGTTAKQAAWSSTTRRSAKTDAPHSSESSTASAARRRHLSPPTAH